MGTTGAPIGPRFDIPDFTVDGALPPFLGPTPLLPAAMSPYHTTLAKIAEKLCKSNERRLIFKGLLTYRKELASIGLHGGIQWLSGSFMEDIEALESRHPNDIDVVTLCRRPPHVVGNDAAWKTFFDANIKLFHPVLVKAAYKCDSYFIDLDSGAFNVVNLTRYWFGLFSHRRNKQWKGLLQVSLEVTQDDAAASLIVAP